VEDNAVYVYDNSFVHDDLVYSFLSLKLKDQSIKLFCFSLSAFSLSIFFVFSFFAFRFLL